MDMVLYYVHILSTGVLIGKVILLSFVVAPILTQTLDPESFGKVVRRLFPAYYLLGLVKRRCCAHESDGSGGLGG